MSSQLTTCTSRVIPVLALYLSANCFQKAAVWSLEYSAATNLIDETFDPPPLLLLFLLPLPLLHAASVNTATPMPANNAVLLDAIVPPDQNSPVRTSLRHLPPARQWFR